MAHINFQVGSIQSSPFVKATGAHKDGNGRGSIFVRIDGVSVQFSGTPDDLENLGMFLFNHAGVLRQDLEKMANESLSI